VFVGSVEWRGVEVGSGLSVGSKWKPSWAKAAVEISVEAATMVRTGRMCLMRNTSEDSATAGRLSMRRGASRGVASG